MRLGPNWLGTTLRDSTLPSLLKNSTEELHLERAKFRDLQAPLFRRVQQEDRRDPHQGEKKDWSPLGEKKRACGIHEQECKEETDSIDEASCRRAFRCRCSSQARAFATWTGAGRCICFPFHSAQRRCVPPSLTW